MAKIRNNRNICLNCFGDLNEERVCVKCGKKADDTPNHPHHLKKRSLLQKRYLINRAIGEGGFGITYLAWDITNATRVAIKEYYPSGYVSRDPRSNQIIINAKQNHAASNRGLKRFIDEAKNLTKIKNLNGIVNVFDFFSANNTAYIVMEYLDGISLKRYVKRKGKLDAAATLTILKPVILSLAKVHDAGLIHRDISPDNILITKTNEVKLIDFGASKHANPEGQSMSIVLKQGFAPEEQYRLHGEQGPWTDIYALGVTIYYCITGQLPPESIQRMYEDTLIPPSKLGANVSPEFERALLKSVAVYAKDRYQNIFYFAKDLYTCEPLGSGAPAPSDNTPALSDEFNEDADDENTTEEKDERTDGQSTADEIEEITPESEDAESIDGNRRTGRTNYSPRTTAVKRKITPDVLKRILSGEAVETAVKEEYSVGDEVSEAQDEFTENDTAEYTASQSDDDNSYSLDTVIIPDPVTGKYRSGGESNDVFNPYKRRTQPTARKYTDFAAKMRAKLG